MNTLLDQELTRLLGDAYTSLDLERKKALRELYSKRRKTKIGTYVWWFFNLHYAYLGQWRLCILFFLSFGGLLLWWVIDFFRIPTILEEYNRKTAGELLNVVGVSS